MAAITILDGPVGTELAARGVPTPLPQWSAWALRHRPEAVAGIHRDYAAAGAVVHTANTFRTKRRTFPEDWEELARLAVALARQAVPPDHRVAGSIAPLEDCYSPWLSPSDPRPEHCELARVLADAGVDLLLCETFPDTAEGLIALEEAVATGLPSWISFTAGPNADLLTLDEIHAAASLARERGAAAVLVNCIPATRMLEFVQALRGCGLPFGAYANAGAPDDRIGWKPHDFAADRYAGLAAQWVAAGATIIGACCGTGPEHIAALARQLQTRSSAPGRC